MANSSAYNRSYYEKNAERIKAHVYSKWLEDHPLLEFRCEECGYKFEARKVNRKLCGSAECKKARAARHSRISQNKRRAAKTFAYSDRDLQRLINRLGGLCAYCGEGPGTEIDHVIPLKRGGVDGIGNFLPACAACNKAKTDKLLIEWRHGRKRRI